MLEQLMVKDLALIEKSLVEFGPGLNILTGETGAGKSILLGSILREKVGYSDKRPCRNTGKVKGNQRGTPRFARPA